MIEIVLVKYDSGTVLARVGATLSKIFTFQIYLHFSLKLENYGFFSTVWDVFYVGDSPNIDSKLLCFSGGGTWWMVAQDNTIVLKHIVPGKIV